MSAPRVLVAGIGNVFLGDDGFGVEVARRLQQRALPASVRVVDYGIRGFDLAYAILDGPDAVILVDAMPGGEAAGTVTVVDADLATVTSGGAEVQGHVMTPAGVLDLVRMMGGTPPRVLVVGCEPESFGTEEGGEGRMELSAPVAAAVGPAADAVERLARRVLDGSLGVAEPAARGMRP